MSEVERLMMFHGRHPRGTGMSRHFMLWKMRHQERMARQQEERGKPYWRRAKQTTSPVHMGIRERAYGYALQNLGREEIWATGKASARASAAEGLVLFQSTARARKGLLRLHFTPAQTRNLLKRRPHGMQGAKPTLTVIDEVRDVPA